jgi:hypothetical protein
MVDPGQFGAEVSLTPTLTNKLGVVDNTCNPSYVRDVGAMTVGFPWSEKVQKNSGGGYTCGILLIRTLPHSHSDDLKKIPSCFLQ